MFRAFTLLALLTAAALGLDQAGAEAAVARGWTAYEASNTDRAQIVPAALAFTEALHYYADKGDDEMARELQASVYWCRKRMSEDTLDAYLAAKSGDAQLVQEMKVVADRDVGASEAGSYFANAEAFAAAHPTEHLKLAIRYFEVASRFAGTQEAMDAQKRSLDEQVQAKTGDAKATTKPARPAAVKPEAKNEKAPPKNTSPLGRWKTANYVLTLNESGVAVWNDASHSLEGHWSIDKSKKPWMVAIKWSNGFVYKIQNVDGDTMSGFEAAADGSPMTMFTGTRLPVDPAK